MFPAVHGSLNSCIIVKLLVAQTSDNRTGIGQEGISVLSNDISPTCCMSSWLCGGGYCHEAESYFWLEIRNFFAEMKAFSHPQLTVLTVLRSWRKLICKTPLNVLFVLVWGRLAWCSFLIVFDLPKIRVPFTCDEYIKGILNIPKEKFLKLNIKRKIWTWTRIQTCSSRSLAWRKRSGGPSSNPGSGSNFSLDIQFSKWTKAQIIRFIFTNNLIQTFNNLIKKIFVCVKNISSSSPSLMILNHFETQHKK